MSLFVPLSQDTLSFSITSLSLNQCHFTSHVFERFGFMPKFTNPSVVEFSGLRGVAGCLWFNDINYGHMPIYIFLLLEVPHVSDSAAEDITLRIVLHSVCIGLFLSWLVFIGLGEGQSLRYK